MDGDGLGTALAGPPVARCGELVAGAGELCGVDGRTRLGWRVSRADGDEEHAVAASTTAPIPLHTP